jgi:hypothetical protein
MRLRSLCGAWHGHSLHPGTRSVSAPPTVQLPSNVTVELLLGPGAGAVGATRRVLRRPGSEPERLRHLPGQLVLAHRGVDLDDGQFEALRLLHEAIGEHPVAFAQVAPGPFPIGGLARDVPHRATTVERGPAELRRWQEPDGVAGLGEQGLDEVGYSRKPSAIATVSAGRRSRCSTIRPKPSPWNQWKVSSMVPGDRFTQRSFMSMVLNLLRYGASSGMLRRAWAGITSSVAHTCSPCWAAMRRAMVDLPAPLPPPIQ